MNDACLSKPQLYGGFGGFPREARFVRRQRQRMNMVAVCQCLFLPWLLFMAAFALTSFHLHYSKPWLCWLLVGGLGGLVLIAGAFAAMAVRRKLKQNESAEPTWFVFLFLTMAIGLAVGAVLGHLNFTSFMQRYYDYVNLNDYNFVNPSRMRGQQMMDGGRITFLPGAQLDFRKAMGFKNLNTYCVVPITMGGLELSNYDFWAVGLDCCSDDIADFTCGEALNKQAHAGLRLLQDEERAFYRLAVQQAENMYHIKALHPLFLYWTEDPHAEMNSWRSEGYMFFFIAMVVHFLWQMLCVGLGVMGFSKMGHY